MTESKDPGSRPDLDSGSSTDVGLVRDLNEDAVLVGSHMFVVADGMGGHAAGEVAAALALQAFAPLAAFDSLRPDDVIAAIADANASILRHAARQDEAAGMGTTVSGLCLGSVGGSPHWFVFNVGDSRVYRFAGGALTQVTVDHSEVEELVATKQITPDEARTHPRRNVVTRSLGSDPAPMPDIWVLPATPGDRFVVCSDGLTTELLPEQIVDVLAQETPAQAAADELVALAVSAGGHDNVSVIVVGLTAVADSVPAEVSTAPRGRLSEGVG